ncbi:MAG TPA: LLM class F420-dependent oxidoreductase [Deltaproteobacteria bacterium]|nr:LLM class F420-dependent oxidoreductase [Deltaproteobacteria bacterium]
MKDLAAAPRFGITLPFANLPLPGHGPLLQEASQLGYTDAWTSETSGADAFSPLAFAAALGSRLRLGTAIAGVYSRGPALLAMNAAALCEAAPGRFVLGIGASSPAMVEGWNAARFERPLSRVRDTLRFLRRALAGERVDEVYETFAVRGFRLERPPASPPPIYLAALREGMLRLAGREADGVILGLLSAEDVARVVAILGEGGGGKDVVARIAVCPSADPRKAREVARRILATYLQIPVYGRFHDWLGRGELLRPMREAARAGDREAARRALPDALVDALFVHGTPEECREKLGRFVAAGVRTLVVQLFAHGGDPREALRALAPRGL